MPRKKQQHAGGQQLVLTDHSAVGFSSDERAEQIVSRICATGGHELAEVGCQCRLAFVRAPDGVGRFARHNDKIPAAMASDHRLNWCAIFGEQLQEVGDHRGRLRVRQVGDHVHVAGCLNRIDQSVDDLPDPNAHAFHDAWCERRPDQRSNLVCGGGSEYSILR